MIIECKDTKKNRICASAMRFLFIGRPQTGSYLGFRGVDQ